LNRELLLRFAVVFEEEVDELNVLDQLAGSGVSPDWVELTLLFPPLMQPITLRVDL
jgi:hypothetical protein